jgi:hypothetical protein
MSDTTSIPLTKSTRDLLKKYGKKGETYDDVLRRLIEIAEQVEFFKKQKRILDEEEFIPLEQV